jgi:hypothetical protein
MKTTRSAKTTDTRLPAYTPAEIAESERVWREAREIAWSAVDRAMLAEEHADAEGEAY